MLSPYQHTDSSKGNQHYRKEDNEDFLEGSSSTPAASLTIYKFII